MNGGTAMKAGMAAAVTAALPLNLSGAAAAAPAAQPAAGHRLVQVTGSMLETALRWEPGSDVPVPAWMPVRLISRVRALYR